MNPEIFLQAIFKNLVLAKNKYPDKYAWPDADILEVFRRLAESVRNGTYDRHVHAIKWACRDCKIAYTREAINEIFKNEPKESAG